VFETTGTYYDAPGFEAETATECGWVHTLADVVTALAQAGLRIEYLHQHPATAFRMLPSFTADDNWRWGPPRAQQASR
jgi:hypothetical protein